MLALLVLTRSFLNHSKSSKSFAATSVPSLLVLKLAYCEGQTPMLESMPLLVGAVVRLGWFDEDRCGKDTNEDHCGEGTDEDYLCRNCCGLCANCCGNNNSHGCVLLGGLSSVRYLTLDPSYQMFTIKRDLQRCPRFSNLRTLTLDQWRLIIGFKALLFFLQHTLLLEKLIINVPKDIDDVPNLADIECGSQIAQFIHLPYLSVVEVRYRKTGFKPCHWELMKLLEVSVKNLKQFNVFRDDWYVPNY